MVEIANGRFSLAGKVLRRAIVSDVGRRRLWVVDLETFKTVSEPKLDAYAPGPLAVNGRGDLLAVACPEVDIENRWSAAARLSNQEFPRIFCTKAGPRLAYRDGENS